MEAIILLLACLTSSSFQSNQASAQADPVYDGKTAIEWAELLRAGDASQRKKAAESLGNMGPDARPATEQLLLTLKADKNADVRAESAWALCEMGVPAKSSIDQLLNAVHDTDSRVRRWCLRALGKDSRPWAQKTGLPGLVFALALGGVNVQEQITFMEDAAIQAKKVLPAFVEALKDPDSKVRLSSVIGIENYARWAEETVPGLCLAIKDSNDEVRLAAERALLQVDFSEAKKQGIKPPQKKKQ